MVGNQVVVNGGHERDHEESLLLSVSSHDHPQDTTRAVVSVAVSMESTTRYSEASLDREAQRWKHLLLLGGEEQQQQHQHKNEWGDVTRLTLQVHSHTHHEYHDSSEDDSVVQRRRGPAGVSIEATFRVNDDDDDDDTSLTTVRDRYEALLRAIVGQRLVCAPLDAIRIRRNHHPTSIRAVIEQQQQQRQPPNPNNETMVVASTTLSGESGEPFCTESIQSFLDLLPKHCDTTGLFMGAHTTTTLSNVLLGVAPNSDSFTQTPNNHHRSLWIELSLQPPEQHQQHQTIQVKQGVQYSVSFLPDDKPLLSSKRNSLRQQSFSLADAVLGGQALHPTKSRQLQSCPLVDSTLISTQLGPSIIDHDTNHSQFHFARKNHPHHPSKEDSTSSSISDSIATYNVWLQNKENDTSVNWNQPWIIWDDSSIPEPNTNSDNMDDSAVGSRHQTMVWAVEQWVDTPRGVTNSGTLVSMLRNAGIDGSTHVSVQSHLALDIMTPILHTVQLQLYQGNHAGQEGFDPNNSKSGDGWKNVTRWSLTDMPGFKMTVMGKEDVMLEWSVTLPPDSSLVTSIEYDAVFPSFEHFPADPNRGVHVPPLVAHFVSPLACCHSPSNEDCPVITLYSSSPLLLPPVPDMSMPFNVISLTSTFFAFLLGTMLNLMGRKSSRTLQRLLLGQHDKKDATPKHLLIQRLVARIQSKCAAFSQLFLARTATNDPSPHPPDQKEPSSQETPIMSNKKAIATNKKGTIT